LQITHIITGLTVGGAQQLLLNLSQEMKARGHRVRIIGLRPGGLAPDFRREGFEVDELQLNGTFGLATFFRLVALLKRQAPDVVHTHLGRADNYGRLAAKLARVPVIVTTVHNVDAWKANPLLRWLDAWTSRFAQRLLACSGRVGQHLRELNLVPRHKISVVRNGIRLGDWNDQPEPTAVSRIRTELNLQTSHFVLAVIGRLEEQKGHRYLLEALASLNGQIPNWRLLVVGEGTLRNRLEKQAAQLKLSTQIVFAGERRDMRLIYAASDVVVLPSLWEGLPLVLLEAMAARRPVIATTAGGIPEVLRHEVTGRLVTPEDSLGLAAAIQSCYSQPEKTLAMAEAAYRTVINHCSIETTAERVLGVYESLMGKPTAARKPVEPLQILSGECQNKVGSIRSIS
jgi:glycosyltransferase involved in cell wall biosynthesis